MIQYSNDMLDSVYTKNEKGEIIIKDVNFYDLELIEESFDELFYEFSQIKSKIAEVRKQLFTNNK
jgi:DNA-directed RNA polymerase